LLTCCRNPTLKLSPESPPVFTYQTRQKKQSLGINSYLRLVKNAPDLNSKQNQLREWRVETGDWSSVAGEWTYWRVEPNQPIS